MEVLTKADDWLTVKEVAERLGQTPSLVNRSLKLLHDTGFIKRKNVKNVKNSTKYEWKIQ